jgi:hypothetical protein
MYAVKLYSGITDKRGQNNEEGTSEDTGEGA